MRPSGGADHRCVPRHHVIAGEDEPAAFQHEAQMIGRVPRRVQRRELPILALDAVAVRNVDIGREVGVDVFRRTLLAHPRRCDRRAGKAVRLGARRGLQRATPSTWSRCAWVTRMWVIGRPPAALRMAPRCAGRRARVDHGERLRADEIGVGALEGERAGVVGDEALDARRDRLGTP